jgi:hypothetical protein
MTHDENKPTTLQENDDASVNETTTNEQSAEPKATQEQQTNEQRESISDVEAEKTWHNKNALKRGIAMLGYGFIAGFVRLGITLIAVFQFFSLLFAEKPNQPLVKFGQNLNTFLYQINQFLTVNSEMYPFPFADWPDSAPKD